MSHQGPRVDSPKMPAKASPRTAQAVRHPYTGAPDDSGIRRRRALPGLFAKQLTWPSRSALLQCQAPESPYGRNTLLAGTAAAEYERAGDHRRCWFQPMTEALYGQRGRQNRVPPWFMVRPWDGRGRWPFRVRGGSPAR